MYICTFKYQPEDTDCHLCLHFDHHRCAVKGGCPCIAERIEAGTVEYSEVVRDTFRGSSHTALRWRLRYLMNNFSGSLWENTAHKVRFEQLLAVVGYHRKRDTSQFYAAMFLLTANEDIAKRANHCFSVRGIDTDEVFLEEIPVSSYGLMQAAKSLYHDTNQFTIADLADTEAVDTDTFRIIVNTLLIARYGLEVTEIGYEEADHENQY